MRPYILSVIQNILKVLLENIRSHKKISIILLNNTIISSFALYSSLFDPIRLLILAFQLSLDSVIISHNLCHLLNPYIIIQT